MKNELKKIIPISLITKCRVLFEKTDHYIIYLFSKTRLSSSIYYLLFNHNFKREQQSVLKGRLKYYQSLKHIEESNVLLRRNIHRLEKGLIMEPRRDVFGKAFIEETVDAFSLTIEQNKFKGYEGVWFNDVLSKYFNVVGSDTDIDKARKKYNEVCRDYNLVSKGESIPYKYQEIEKSDITFNQLEALFKQRRSVRWYQDKPVDISLINKAVNIATQAPSACNRQPFQFHTLVDKEKVKMVADCAMGTAGFSHNLQMIIAVVGDLSAYPSERDRHVIYIDGSLVTMQLMLALETLGLNSCAINWPDIESREKKLDKLLGLGLEERTVMLMAVGYASNVGGIPYSQKKDSSQLVKVMK
ncbi:MULTISPECIES: nitroreductase family protein [unclassified Pseudoalteromonas]|uniref:nitroreductase family protein n=1 Tax=unclassified Pseudoalteromonas TaxID=194690 RepID=UPI0025B60304|nr:MULTISPECIES: nitroreductase family protein [unclassified Pseudoalteromonas]MDN3379125.1 nitroreductase family protein [Pseudoalteromonas sp. APC 3893]MDN3389219.1 nitroreductase family protein [Pseudoalteromonas sp. APC 4017]